MTAINPYEDNNYTSTAPLHTRIGLHRAFSINPHGWHRWMFEHLRPVPGSRVVELGCGSADLWAAADPAMLEGVELRLFDKSPAMVRAASEKLHSVGTARVDGLDIDGDMDLPGDIDILVANHVLYHVEDPGRTLSTIREKTNDETRCFFATNGERNMHSLNRFLPVRLRDTPIGSLIGSFTLEAGYRLVRSAFGAAYVTRYPDGLNVTDAAPLSSYLESLPLSLSDEEVSSTEERVRRHIETFGSLFVEKDIGFISNHDPSIR